MDKPIEKPLDALIVVLLVWLLSGADWGVRGSRTELMRFDPRGDSFAFLQSWTDIHCANDQQVQHVASLWKRREAIITIPIPDFLVAPAIQRLGNHKFHWIDLAKTTGDEATEHEAPGVDLETIQIIPGEFYLNREHNLCYYHETVIPGKTIDQILAAATPVLAHQVEEFAKDEIRTIREGKRRQFSWDEFRTLMLRNFHLTTEDEKSPPLSERALPLDFTSLNHLANAATQSIKLSRQGAVFSVILPLSADDCRESLTTFELLRDTMQKWVKDGKVIDPAAPKLVQVISMRNRDGAGLELSMNMTNVLKAAMENEKSGTDTPPDERLKASRASTVKNIAKCGIPINRALSIEKVFAKYVVE